jgi:predicted patatin/cPLA2 family phospholipase
LNPVLPLLRSRLARRCRPPFDDGARIALAIEGGAMRGVVSAGMVSALEALGLTRAFDAVYGSSAGALNAAYFLAGQARIGTTIYFEDINNRRFIDLARPLRGKPIVDLGYLIDDVATRRKPLDAARVIDTGALTVLATHVPTASRAALRAFASPPRLLEALRAGATMPVVAGPPVMHGGEPYLDASITEPVPLPLAEADGFTHVLVLLTRPVPAPPRTSLLDRVYVLPKLRRLSRDLAARYEHRATPYSALMGHIQAGRGPAGQAVAVGLRPAGAEIGKLERRAARLQAGAASGYDAVMTWFNGPPRQGESSARGD